VWGEKFGRAEPFHPDRVGRSASWAWAELLSLIDRVQENIDQNAAKKKCAQAIDNEVYAGRFPDLVGGQIRGKLGR